MKPSARIVVPALFLALCSAGCPDAGGSATPPAFDAERAWKGLLHQVEIGPRPSGTPENEVCRQWIESELRGLGLEPTRETFTAKTPAGDLQFANVTADLPGTDPKAGWICVASHFDTKRMPFRFVGANDGASSTAAVIEVARVLAQGGKRAIGYRFVFFDGEEAVREEWLGEDNTYGSRHHVKGLQASGRIETLRALVLLDMVGDKDLKLTSDTLSDRRLMETFTKAARDLGLGKHVGGKSMEVRDDHVPFLMARVRTVDLIDLEFGPNNSYWHTDKDSPENCSKESLAAIGKITLRGLADLETLFRDALMEIPRRPRRALVALIALALAWFASGLVAAWGLSQRWSDPEVERAPVPDGVAVETLELRTQDSRFVRAWLFAPDAPGASVVMLHGWRGSRSTVAHRAAALALTGHAVLAPSLRAHGDSAGARYDFGREAWRDVAACIDALGERRPGRPIVLVGFSYGAAVAAEAAAHEGARIDGLVLDSCFASLRGSVQNRCDLFLPPVLEDLAAVALFAAAPLAFPELDEIVPERRLASIGAAIPVLILRGGLDARATASDADRLAAAAGARGTLVVFAEVEHDRCFETDPERWVATVGRFAAGLVRTH